MDKNAVLTKREAEIAELLAWGAAKREVADSLYISTRTVENTARNIYVKIGIQKATELCVWWFCSKHGVSWDLSPIKRTVCIIILLVFIQSNIMEAHKFERYYRRNNNRKNWTMRRHYRKNETEELDYPLI
jgi:DNA-binding CsgD family transcriptional regulator